MNNFSLKNAYCILLVTVFCIHNTWRWLVSVYACYCTFVTNPLVFDWELLFVIAAACYCSFIKIYQALTENYCLLLLLLVIVLFVIAAACYCFVCYCFCLLLKDATLNPCALRLSSGSALFHLNFWSGTHQLPPATQTLESKTSQRNMQRCRWTLISTVPSQLLARHT